MKRNVRIIKIQEVSNKVGLSKSSIYVMIKEGLFPIQMKVGKRRVGWLESEVDTWIQNLKRVARI